MANKDSGRDVSGVVITFGDDNGGKNHNKADDNDQGQCLDLKRTSVNEWVWSRWVDVVLEEEIVCVLYINSQLLASIPYHRRYSLA